MKEILAKGITVFTLVAWVVYMSFDNRDLRKKLDSYASRMDKLQNQMYDLQNNVIKENTKSLYEFNLKNK